jgi:hypothetical protein
VRAGADGAFLLSVPNVARFEISNGERIVVDPAPGAGERELRVFLLGSAFGALLHQRGMLPLHANSIAVEGHAIAFLGHSGAGKSTLAHWFQRRGFPVLADDVSAISLDSGATAYPGVPRLRLWQDALDAAGLGGETFPRSFAGHEKFDVPARRNARRPLPLGACYVLAQADDGAPAAITRLGRVEAVEALMANTYRGRFVPVMGRTERHLRLCLTLAGRVPVFRASRVWGVADFDEQAEMLKAHAEQLLGGGPAPQGQPSQSVEEPGEAGAQGVGR